MCTSPPTASGAASFVLSCLFSCVGFVLFLLFPVKVLELPGQRRVRFFNTVSLPPPFCFGFVLAAFVFGGLCFGNFLGFFDFVFRY